MKIVHTALGLMLAKLTGGRFYIRFHITHRCNYQCRMCDQRNQHMDRELDLTEIRRVAERVAQLKAFHIVITGGEPFLRPDLPDIIAAFKNHHFSVRVQTNGGPQVTHDRFMACVQAGLQDISVSMDTLDKKVQDDICKSHDVVDNALRTLQMSRHILPYGISQANIVASKYNFTELPDLVRFFSEKGIYTYITPVMIADMKGRKDQYQFRSRDTQFRPEDMDPDIIRRVMDELIDLRRHGMGLTNSTRYLKDYKAYLLTGQSNWRCEAGTLSLDILPDGRFTICKEKAPIGHILDHDFPEFIHSDLFRQMANKTIGACRGCFYGEYREPQYAVRDATVFQEWVRDWARTFRHGMRFKKIDKPFH
ncbi:radical SAM protein [bacterium]|nr:radical SAM protein [bacterium]